MAERLLAVQGLHAGYAEAVVLEDVALHLDAGEALAVLGRNGVGKTTLMATLAGLTTMHAGSIRLGADDIGALAPQLRSRKGLALVPQTRQIFRSLTVHENLQVAAVPGAWTVDRVYELFPRLRERQRNLGHQLSGGEQQMLAIGRALVTCPRVVLLDEPFEGLAPVIVDTLLVAFERLRGAGDVGIVLVEQHAQLALELTERALVLDRGRVVWQGPSATLQDDPARIAALLGLEAA